MKKISPAKAQRRKEDAIALGALCVFFAPLRLCGSPMVAFHGGQPHNWHDLARAWSFEPLVIISLTITAVLFIIGLYRLKRRSIRTWEALCFAGGWLALFIALVSPVHAWGRVLFSAHMSQHEILMLVAAPLLVLGRPLIAFLWALPLNWSRQLGNIAKVTRINRLWHVFTIPLVALLVHAVALWTWHIPALFDATLHSETVHTLQHLSFLVSALLFW